MGNETSLCVDTDALVNLLALNLLDAALECLGCSRDRCYRLRAASSQIRKARWVEEHWPLFDRVSAQRIVDQLQGLSVSPTVEALEALNIENIDPGDGYLLAAVADSPGLLLLSADQRMIEALHQSSDPAVKAICAAVRGRVILFPQIVASLVSRLSLPAVEQEFRKSFCRQKTLKVIFGSQKPTREADFWAAYESIMKSVRSICGQDWLYPL